MSALQELSLAVLNGPPEEQALEYEKQWYTWGELGQVAREVVALIQESGAPANGKIALVAKNRPSAVAAYLGLMGEGFSFRMVYPFQSSVAMATELASIKPSVIVAAAETYDANLIAALQDMGSAAIALREKSANYVPGLERSTIAPAVSNTPIIEIHTSGTTGTPKPFEFDYDTVASHIVGGRATPSSVGADPKSLPPVLMYFPAGNITGLHSTIAPLLRGLRGMLLDRFSVEGWHDHLVRYRPAAGGLPPAGVQMILDADLPPEDFRSLKMIGSGSAPLDPTVQKRFEERYNVPILLAYGATEFGGPVASMTPEVYQIWGDRKVGSVGKAFPGVKLRVIDPNNFTELSAGAVGLLEVVSPRMGEHWIRTSDLAYLDEDGFLFLCGRADGAIMRGGFKILPETIEKALLQHPAVAAAGVVGVADHRLGQVPAAAIQAKAGQPLPSVEELEVHLREHVASTHIPVKWKFVEALPRTASYKIHQPALRELFE
ncbi:MAG: class I adenylate-forming enzyme family protein [Pseudomonadota bacterium]|nr:class I adenylate-forming enzyme family protein [Pseudomonadota bacterium]